MLYDVKIDEFSSRGGLNLNENPYFFYYRHGFSCKKNTNIVLLITLFFFITDDDVTNKESGKAIRTQEMKIS